MIYAIERGRSRMKNSTRLSAIASLASFFTGLSLFALAGDPPKHPPSTKPVGPRE